MKTPSPETHARLARELAAVHEAGDAWFGGKGEYARIMKRNTPEDYAEMLKFWKHYKAQEKRS